MLIGLLSSTGTRDMSAWRQAQKALISEFQTDASIHHPSRIMRLAGTISWPSADKRAKGYIPELVRLDRPGTPRNKRVH